nr:hypothetical protein CFP56_59699 [Quercus suber]
MLGRSSGCRWCAVPESMFSSAVKAGHICKSLEFWWAKAGEKVGDIGVGSCGSCLQGFESGCGPLGSHPYSSGAGAVAVVCREADDRELFPKLKKGSETTCRCRCRDHPRWEQSAANPCRDGQQRSATDNSVTSLRASRAGAAAALRGPWNRQARKGLAEAIRHEYTMRPLGKHSSTDRRTMTAMTFRGPQQLDSFCLMPSFMPWESQGEDESIRNKSLGIASIGNFSTMIFSDDCEHQEVDVDVI